MSRRDTIIIAVLVNAGLLMVLFATAMRPKKIDLAPETLVIGESRKEEILKEAPKSNLRAMTESSLVITEPEAVIFADHLGNESIVIEVPQEEEIIAQDPMKYVTVTVKKGDFLEKIAHANGTTVAAVMEVNHLTSTKLKIGQSLKIPLPSQGKVSSSPTEDQRGEEYYVVREGDNPWLIATRNKVKWEDLLRLNGLDESRARRLRPGDKLRLH
ncbi:MAG: LysM peptidoglycan-binding domain-containing protein [Chlamydiia bacterium]|nr:LysM peptidoglycan-binding domain-containing protein [Chlamydiia bacterium]